jgi:hypothetical protein
LITNVSRHHSIPIPHTILSDNWDDVDSRNVLICCWFSWIIISQLGKSIKWKVNYFEMVTENLIFYLNKPKFLWCLCLDCDPPPGLSAPSSQQYMVKRADSAAGLCASLLAYWEH